VTDGLFLLRIEDSPQLAAESFNCLFDMKFLIQPIDDTEKKFASQEDFTGVQTS